MSLRKLKLQPGDRVTYTDPETGIEHRNITVLEVRPFKTLIRNSYGYPVEVPREMLRPAERDDASMVTGRVSAGPKPKPPAKVFHVR